MMMMKMLMTMTMMMMITMMMKYSLSLLNLSYYLSTGTKREGLRRQRLNTFGNILVITFMLAGTLKIDDRVMGVLAQNNP